jgi:hypothetical protein
MFTYTHYRQHSRTKREKGKWKDNLIKDRVSEGEKGSGDNLIPTSGRHTVKRMPNMAAAFKKIGPVPKFLIFRKSHAYAMHFKSIICTLNCFP